MKKLISFVLALLFCVSLIPTTALATLESASDTFDNVIYAYEPTYTGEVSHEVWPGSPQYCHIKLKVGYEYNNFVPSKSTKYSISLVSIEPYMTTNPDIVVTVGNPVLSMDRKSFTLNVVITKKNGDRKGFNYTLTGTLVKTSTDLKVSFTETVDEIQYARK